jgi:hypothetical protein
MYFDENEKNYISLIEYRVKHFNQGRRNGLAIRPERLDVHYYVSGGNKARILWDGSTIAGDLTIHEMFYFVSGFIRAMEAANNV